MSAFGALIRRDLGRAFAHGGAWLPLVFYLLIATLFPFAVGPDAELLGKIGGGALWTAALLAALLPVERLIRPDLSSGLIDQLLIRGQSDEAIAAAKFVAHWLSFGPPLMLATLPAAALLRLDAATLLKLEAGLALGTPGLAALGLSVAALTAGMRSSGALVGLLMLPLAVPLLIFGAGAGGLKLVAATSLLFVAAAPFVGGAALRSGRI
ncbi:MAG TPA: heme exporter protein CcmB [Sphingomonas sp.]|nr:heme exporter protein CcmB [Sphingomonas sp.]